MNRHSRPKIGFVDAYEAWLQDRRVGGIGATTEYYIRRQFEGVRAVLGNRPVGELRAEDFLKVRGHMAQYSPSWHNITRTRMRAFWKWCRRLGWVDSSDPIDIWDRVKEVERRVKVVLAPEEAARFLDVLRPDYRRWAHWALLTGMRTGSCRSLQWRDILDYPDGSSAVSVPAEKMKMRRAWSARLAPAARQVLGPRGAPEEYVFCLPTASTLSRIFKRAARVAKVSQFISPHQLRTTFANWLLRARVPMEEVRDMGAWKSMKVLDLHYRQPILPARQDEIVNTLPTLPLSASDTP